MLEEIGAAAAAVGSTFLQDRLNRSQSREARDWEGNMFANRYQMQVADLKAAGLNPMLAYLSSPGGVPSTSAQGVQAPDVVGAVNSSRATSAQVANVRQDTMKKAAEAENIEVDTLVKGGMIKEIAALTGSAMASAEQSSAMAEQIRATIPKIQAEVSRLSSEVDKNRSDVELNNSLIQANQVLNSLRHAEAVLTGRKAVAEQQGIDLVAPKVKALDNTASESKQFYGRAGIVGDVLKFLNPFGSYKGGR